VRSVYLKISFVWLFALVWLFAFIHNPDHTREIENIALSRMELRRRSQ